MIVGTYNIYKSMVISQQVYLCALYVKKKKTSWKFE